MERPDWQDTATLFKKAITAGAQRTGASSCIWKVHGDCLEPFVKVHKGTPRAKSGERYWVWTPERRSTLYVEMWLRCNHCRTCLMNRARLWSRRIRYETENAPRSWFGTLTLNPQQHVQCELLAQSNNRAYFQLTPRQQLKERLAVSGSEVTRYLKRVRKQATGKLRFVCVTELHKSGYPHYHLLIHEQVRGCVLHKMLANQWSWGFEKWRVLDPQTAPAWYLCKYLTKENIDRVRASIRYGGGA